MLALQLAALLLAAAPQKLDLVIERGRVVDGSGSPWFRADVGIQGDRITRMGDLREVPAKLRIDARDHLVTPGFIDLLGQSELSLLVDPRAESKIRQGITSELTGELGTVAPIRDEILGGVMGWLSLHRIKIDWKDLDGYWKRLRATRPAINIGTLVSTGQVGAVVMGQGSEAPTPEQLLRMQIEVQKAMRQGAFGVAAALEYPPASYQRTEELVLLARSAAKFGGFYATHLRNEGDTVLQALDEAVDIGRRAGLPIEVWHLKARGKQNWGRMPEVLKRIAAARAEGLDISANVYPYLAMATPLHPDVPDWAQAGGVSAMLGRLKDKEQRTRIEKEITASWKDPSEPERVVILLALSPRRSATRARAWPTWPRARDHPCRGAGRSHRARWRQHPGAPLHRQRIRPPRRAARTLGRDRRRCERRCPRRPHGSRGHAPARLRLHGPAARHLRARREALHRRGSGAEGHLRGGATARAHRAGTAPPGDDG
jgi:dihydroorotase/N-acyl-D-amino-acid deacylase